MLPLPLTSADRILIEATVMREAPKIGVAYFLWAFLGSLGAHRFYLGRPATAILQILLNLILIGFLWVLVDAALIPRFIEQRRAEIRKRLIDAAQ